MKSVHHQILRCGICFLLGNLFACIFFHTHFAKEYFRKNYQGKLHIFIKDRAITVNAFVDTGNHLYEPVSGRPVCLVEYDVVKKYLNPDVMNLRTWPIPYRTIGKCDGLLWGVTADKLIFQNKWRKNIKSGCIIAFYHGKIGKSGEYGAIVHPDILEK